MKKTIPLFSVAAIFSSSAVGMELDIPAGTTSTQTTTTLENNYLGGVNIGSNGTLLIQQVGSGSYRPTQGFNGIRGPGGVTINAIPNPDTAVIQFTGLPNNYSGSTTLEAGILQGQASPQSVLTLSAGTSYKLGGANQSIAGLKGVQGSTIDLGANTITIGQPNVFSDRTFFNGNITGTGGLVLNGLTTLVLDGSNTYTGGTTVNAGTLVGTTDSFPPSGPITVFSNLTFAQPTEGTFAGSLSSGADGFLSIIGGGTVVLTGSNTNFTGSISIGEVQLNANLEGTTSTIPSTNIDIFNGSLIFNQGNQGTFSETLSGSGSVTLTGGGSYKFTGTNNSYTGGTIIDDGVLTVQTENLPLNGPVTFNNNSGLAFQQLQEGTFSGNISGYGFVEVDDGPGTVTLTGTNTYTGITKIVEGKLTGSAGTSTTPGSLPGNIEILDSGILTFSQQSSETPYIFSGNITDNNNPNAIQVNIEGNTGPFILTLGGENTYTAPTTVNSAVATLQDSSMPNSTLNLSIAGATYTLDTASQTIGSLSGVTGSIVNLGANTLTAGGNNTTTTFSGVIQDGGQGGSFTKEGTGTLTLAVPPNYTGSTTINGGTLQVSGPLPAADLILNGGSFPLSVSQNFTTLSGTGGSLNLGTSETPYTLNILGDNSATQYNFGGSITGAGIFIFGGSSSTGILSLTGSNSYTGGTIISAKSTLIGTTGSLPPSGTVTNSGLLTFNQSQSGTFGGTIIGAGSVTIEGGAEVTFTGDNKYIGGTTINNDGSNLIGTTNSLPPGGSIVDNSILTFNQDFDGTFTGNISGTGQLVTEGTGTVTFNGSNTLSGNTDVSKGTFVANGGFPNSIFNIGPHGTLRGNGNINSLTLAGAVAPGNSIGTLTILNDFTMLPTGIYEAEINSGGASDRLNMGGKAFIDGTLDVRACHCNRSSLKNKAFSILSTSDGVVGRFTNLISQDRIKYLAKYLRSGIQIAVTSLQDFADASSPTSTSNVARAEHYFDTFADSTVPGTDLNYVIKGLDELLLTENTTLVNNAFNQIQPSQYKELGQISFLQNELVNRTVGSQQQNLRESLWVDKELEAYAGSAAISPQRVASFHHLAKSAKGFKSSSILQTQSQPRHRLGMLALPGSERVGMPANNWIKLGRSSVWVQSYGQIESTKGNHGNAGIRSETGGISLGGDHEVMKNTYLGFLGGMSTTPFHWQQGRGSGRIKSYYGGLYGTWLSQTGFYADGQLIAGGDNYNSHRNIVYPGVNRKARQSHSGGQFSTDLQAGYVWSLKHLTVQPYADATYMFVNESGFQEKGAQSLDFKIKGRMPQFFRGEIGAQVYKTYVLCDALIRPALQLSWVHKRSMGPNSAKVQGGLVGQSQSLVVSGDNRTRNQVAPGLALTVQFAKGLYIIGNVSSQFGGGQKLGDALLRIGYDF